jgi:hypothetical protein
LTVEVLTALNICPPVVDRAGKKIQTLNAVVIEMRIITIGKTSSLVLKCDIKVYAGENALEFGGVTMG